MPRGKGGADLGGCLPVEDVAGPAVVLGGDAVDGGLVNPYARISASTTDILSRTGALTR